METFAAYLPADRLQALALGEELPGRSTGAALFADISGFTPLTEALVLVLGPQRGAEELPSRLNVVYGALIAEVDRYGGSVIGFAGDAITCWFDDAAPEVGAASGDEPRSDPRPSATLRAATCGLAMQAVMAQFAAIPIPGAGTVGLGLKVGIARGPVRRFAVGDPGVQRIDVLSGRTLEQMAAAEHQAEKGDVIIDEAAALELGESAQIGEWREDHEGSGRFAVLRGLQASSPPTPFPALANDAIPEDLLRPWLLPRVYERLRAGLGEFLTELRPAVALFMRFGGIDFDGDELAPLRLDAFVVWVQSILTRYDGSLIQLTIGDKGSFLYAAFGAPVAHEDDTVRACLAALELREPRFDYLTAVQIGISQGQMRTGAYGAENRRTYGSLGDEVNMAARLMQQAPPGQVYVSQIARRPTGTHFTWEQLAPIRVKGKSQPVTVFRLIGREEKRRIGLHEPRYGLPMVGREAELATVSERLERAMLGYGQIVGITAEAGMGKSRLIAEVLRLAQGRGIEVVGGECQSYGTSTSYLLWRTVWRGLFDLDTSLPPDEQISLLTVRLARLDATLLPRLPLLGAVLNLNIPDNDLTRSFDARLRKSVLEAMLVSCLRAQAARMPLLVVLEDCHWIDPLSHDLLETLGRAIAELPVMLVLAYRPAQIQRLQSLKVSGFHHFSEIRLSSLPPEEVRELVRLKLRQLFGDDDAVPPDLVDRVNSHAQGNPFYVEELINYLNDRGFDPRQPEVLARIELPPSLQRVILSRIDQLTEQQKTLIKVASVIGRLFWVSLLWGLDTFATQQMALRPELDALSDLDLTPLDTPDPELAYLFKHVVTQEVTYESLPFATRGLLHGQIGEVIERQFGNDIERVLDLLAFHFDRSRNEEKRREYLRRAGDSAQRAYANEAAIDYYTRLLPLLDDADQIEVLLKLGKVLELVGKWAEATEQYRNGLDQATRLGDVTKIARCEAALGFVLWRRNEYAEATRWVEQARATFEQAGDRAGVAQATGYAAMIADRQGDYAAALAAYEASLATWRDLDDVENMAHVLNNMGIMLTTTGEHARARSLQEDALALRRSLGDRWRIGASLINLGLVAINQRNPAEARANFEQALELLREVGDPQLLGNCLLNLAFVTRELGDLRRARMQYGECLLLFKTCDDKWLLSVAFEDMSALEVAEGHHERAIRLVGAARAVREMIGAPLSPVEVERLDESLAPAREALDEVAQGRALALGEAMSLGAAIDYALAA